jgi:hypothetical protein
MDAVISPSALGFELLYVFFLLASETVFAEVVVFEVGAGETETGTWVGGWIPLKMGI